jgi:hypothetical protein
MNICFASGFQGDERYSLISHGRTGPLDDLIENGRNPGTFSITVKPFADRKSHKLRSE